MRKLSRSKILITGAGGFIGSHLCELCLEEGAEVRAFVHYNSRSDWGMLEDLDKKQLNNIEIMAGDLRDSEAVRRAVRGCHRVFHLGALIGIPYSYVNPEDVVQTNVLGALYVLRACLESGVERLVHTSTSEVYGTAQYVPMNEKHPLNPQSPYAASKVGSDKLAESYYRAYSLPVVILRPFNTYGPRQSPRAVIPAIILQALHSSTVRLGNLDPRRDLTFVKDTARGFIAAACASKVEGETIQLGAQQEYAVKELVGLIGAILNKRLRVISEIERRRPKGSEVERLYASNQAARERLNWRPKVPLRDGLEKTVCWFKAAYGSIFQKCQVSYIAMKTDARIIIVLPAYNAAKTLEKTYADIPKDKVSKIILVDDVSQDQTVEVARSLGLSVVIHIQNRGYGGNQKTCYLEALKEGADVVVMLHPDHQYDSKLVPELVQPILDNKCDMVMGSRILNGRALEGGMPFWKYLANRILTITENVIYRRKFTDCHSGFRAYSRELLTTVPFLLNSDDFVFDSQMIAQAVYMGFRIDEISVQARYFPEASSVNFKVSTIYGIKTVAVMLRFLLQRLGIIHSRFFDRKLTDVVSKYHHGNIFHQ